ncbi:MAG: diguanylate cyclase [Candidatus Aminicenantes bacterium]|nr:diguanylate cyclase [Candidatus Aminicenantes bacterium]
MKVLIAEDDIISKKILEKHIKEWGYEVFTTDNGKKGWNLINKHDIQLAILDWMMPGMNGVDLCKKIRTEYQKKMSRFIYIIMVTGRDLQEDIIAGISAGANDYMTKPFNLLELQVRLQNGRRIVELEENCLRLATYDSLTNLWNRSKIFEFYEEELSCGQKQNQPTGIIMIDIDHFKNINDSYGHYTGDIVLKETARLLKQALRNYDKIGRYGGDELFIVLPKCDQEEIKVIGERLRSTISKCHFDIQTPPLKITISLGGVSSDVFPNASKEELIQACDRALYQAKKLGRNRLVSFDSSLPDQHKSVGKGKNI